MNSSAPNYFDCRLHYLQILVSLLIMELNNIKTKAIPILKKYGVTSAKIFGSYARGEARPDSDLDILISYEKQLSLFDLVGLEQELSEAIGIKVQIVTERALSPYIAPSVKRDAKLVYG